MTKTIAALFGSGIIGGNTDKLLTEAIRGAEDAGCSVERINTAMIKLAPCLQTFGCMTEPHCYADENAEKYYKILRSCDGIIIATPVMTYGIPGSLKSFMDRCQPFYMAKYYRKQPLVTKEDAAIRKMLFICIGGMDTDEIFIGPKLTAKAFGNIIDARYADELLQNNMDSILKIENKPELLTAAYEKGYALAADIVKARDSC